MRTITFYSYKGGAGRTLAAANFAVYLAKLGLKVVLLDFDFEAPGLDSKFSELRLPDGYKGLLDYILEYQTTGKDPGPIGKYVVSVPVSKMGAGDLLHLVPAGDYLTPDYQKKLNQLDWTFLFSERDGVSFFQNLLNQIKHEFAPDFVLIDSRTGITEISGLCTQQLADEVIILTSLSSESIKVTKHISDRIRSSEIAKALHKEIDVKIVVSRVPRPKNLERFRNESCKTFGISEDKLFFLFSEPSLELREFIAIQSPDSESGLVDSYVRLFNGLKVELASQSIRKEIDALASSIFSTPPELIEARVQELATLYPHPDVFRASMQYYRLTRQLKKVRQFARRLLDLNPNDAEATEILGRYYLEEGPVEPGEMEYAARVIKPLFLEKKLSPQECYRYARFLERLEDFQLSHEIAMDLCKRGEGQGALAVEACSLAARTGLHLGMEDLAANLIKRLPLSELSGPLALLAIREREKGNDLEGAFEIALKTLHREANIELLRKAGSLAKSLNRIGQLEEAFPSFERIRMMSRHNPSFSRHLSEALLEIGLPKLAREVRRMGHSE